MYRLTVCLLANENQPIVTKLCVTGLSLKAVLSEYGWNCLLLYYLLLKEFTYKVTGLLQATQTLMAIFTLKDKQINRLSGIWSSDVNLCHTAINLFVSMSKSSWKNWLFRLTNIEICSSNNLFVQFAHQMICSSETICPSRQFVCPLV